MNITLSIVMRELAPFLATKSPGNTQKKTFSDIAFLTENIQVDPSVLYISTFDNLLNYIHQLDDNYFVVCNGSFPDVSKVNFHLIELDSGANLFEVCNILQNLKFRLLKWEADVEAAILSEAGLQTLLDISEPFFTNPIFLTTRSLQIPACTQNIPIAHPDLVFAANNRFFPPEMIREIVSKNYLEESESHAELSFSYLPNYIGCPLIVKRFSENAMQLNTICLYGLNEPPTEADFDCMLFLSEAIFRYANGRSNNQISDFNQNKYSSFLIDIIEGKVSEHEIQSYATFFGIEPESNFQVHILLFDNYVESHIQYMLHLLKANLPYANIFRYQDRIVLLIRAKQGNCEAQFSSFRNQLSQLIQHNAAHCGYSDIFFNIANLKDAYMKAEVAANIGKQLNPDNVIYEYQNYYIYHLLQCAEKEISYNSLYLPQLDRILQYDKTHNSDNIKLLEYYLNCDRNITKVSNLMNLHRNSVLYRISKIENLLALSLDDPEIRLTLLVSFKALKLLQLEQQKPVEV